MAVVIEGIASNGELLRRLTAGGSHRLTIQHRQDAGQRPACHAQQRLWYLSKLEGAVATYSAACAFRVTGKISFERLDWALTRIVARHEAIRTRLLQREGIVFQEILPPMPMRTKLSNAASMEQAIEQAHAEAAVPFHLGHPPLLRSVCVRVTPEQSLLAFIFHHAAFDAWSVGIFFSELSALYRCATPADADIGHVPFQYSDYADWQREWLTGAAAQAQRDYWRQRLADPPPTLRLGQAHAPGRLGSLKGQVHRFTVCGALHDRINDVAASHRTTVFVVVLCAFLSVLHRYSLQEDIIVGVPVACRSFKETEGIIGDFTNTLALRSAISGELRFTELIEQTSKCFFEGLAHQELPFDRVLDSLQFVRETAGNPVFQAMLVMQNTLVDAALQLAGAELDGVPIHTGTAKVDVTCSIKSIDSAFEIEVEYCEALSRPEAVRFAEGFRHLLCDAVSRPSARIEELALLSSEEAAALAGAAVEHCESYTDVLPAHVYFEHQSRHAPDAVAIEAGGTSIRYSELNERANRLAWQLIELGAGPESLIMVCVDRGVDLVVALLGVAKAGAAFVPLDPRFPFERIRTICSEAQPLCILTEERHRSLMAELPTPAFDVAGPRTALPGANPNVEIAPANVAFVYYTSGSTGVPKGVVIEHRCAGIRLEWLRRRYPLRIGERVLHKTPLIFDVAIWEIFLPLATGATILMVDANAESDVEHIAALLRARGTVLAHFVPSMLDAYLKFVSPGSYPDLRWVAVSGEATPAPLLERFVRHFAVELHNQYGQTETSEVAAWEGKSHVGTGTVPLGRQIGAYRLHVMDSGLNPVPVGVAGELCVAGHDGLARGYHSRPDWTAEKFVPNPHPLVPGERLYRTGDLARMSDDGLIEYLGRLDQQTKIRGCRVEIAEVEATLNRHDAVRSCCVIVRPDETGASQLIAYVVGDEAAAAGLGAHVEKFLPSFMLPSGYIFLKQLPLTPSGKLDRMKLPALRASDFTAHARVQPPQRPLEMQLAVLWGKILGVERVGRTDNFFAIGGNSIRSIQVLSKIKQTFDVEVSVRDFLESPTIEGLAVAIERAIERLIASLSDAEVLQRLEAEKLACRTEANPTDG